MRNLTAYVKVKNAKAEIARETNRILIWLGLLDTHTPVRCFCI